MDKLRPPPRSARETHLLSVVNLTTGDEAYLLQIVEGGAVVSEVPIDQSQYMCLLPVRESPPPTKEDAVEIARHLYDPIPPRREGPAAPFATERPSGEAFEG